MKIIDSYRLARGNLKRTKLRSFLTVSGVVVSIGAIVLLVSLAVGLQRLSVSRMASINALTRLTAMPKENSSEKIDETLISKASKLPNVEFVSPEVQYPARVTFLETQSDIITVGIQKERLAFNDIEITKGQNFSSNSANEAIVSNAVLKLFGKENDPEGVLGDEMQFQVFVPGDEGKTEEKKITAKIVGTTNDETVSNVYLPINLIHFDNLPYSSISIKVTQRQLVKNVKQSVEAMGLQSTTVSDLIDQVDQVFFYFEIILATIGGIALFVAAIGIINTMTISLLERTHEIGIMKALGARDGDIKRVFHYESAMIGFTGGILGIASGWLVGTLINFGIAILLRMNGSTEEIKLFIMPSNFALFILGFSTFLSFFAGIYPARRAAKLSPLQALRYQ